MEDACAIVCTPSHRTEGNDTMSQDRPRTMERTQISLRPYQAEYVRDNEAFNLSGFVREHLDEKIPTERVPDSQNDS